MSNMYVPHFLKYQAEWLKDESAVKIWEKSRRIGATYVQSYEDVRDVLSGKVQSVWFSSADETAAREYILYCRLWVKIFRLAARRFGWKITGDRNAEGVKQITFSGGGRITALSSNPKGFRSKGGKVVLDEFAHHADAYALWKAARPAVTWGHPLRILSTHNGKLSLFYQFTQSIKNGSLNWKLHTTDIYRAIDDGLLTRILGKVPDEVEKNSWLADLRKNCFSEDAWREEFCCEPVDSSTAFLPMALIRQCIDENISSSSDEGRFLYAGMDIGRKNDLSVICIIEPTGELNILKEIIILRNEPFSAQKKKLFALLENRSIVKIHIDATGPGMQMAEECAEKFGAYRCVQVSFTASEKEKLALLVIRSFEDRTIRIPDDKELIEELHSMKTTPLAGGGRKIEYAGRGNTGHGDRFWALALALQAAQNPVVPPKVYSGRRRITKNLLQKF